MRRGHGGNSSGEPNSAARAQLDVAGQNDDQHADRQRRRDGEVDHQQRKVSRADESVIRHTKGKEEADRQEREQKRAKSVVHRGRRMIALAITKPWNREEALSKTDFPGDWLQHVALRRGYTSNLRENRPSRQI